MGLRHTFYQAGGNLKGSGEAIVDAFKNFSKNISSGGTIVHTSPGRIERGFLGALKYSVGVPLKAGLRVADWGAGVLIKPVAWLAAAPGAFFRAFPAGAPIITVVGSVLGIGSWLAHRRTNAMMEQYAASQNAAMQAAAMQQPAYRLQPGEHMAVDEALARRQDEQPAGHAAAVSAAREQLNQQPIATSV